MKSMKSKTALLKQASILILGLAYAQMSLSASAEAPVRITCDVKLSYPIKMVMHGKDQWSDPTHQSFSNGTFPVLAHQPNATDGKPSSFAETLAFLNVEDAAKEQAAGNYTRLISERAWAAKPEDISYIVRAIVYRKGNPVLATQISLDKKNKQASQFTEHPVKSLLEVEISKFSQKPENAALDLDQKIEALNQLSAPFYEQIGDDSVSSVMLDCHFGK